MELGNWLSPVIIFLITITLLTPLFRAYDRLQQELKRERETKQLMAERERIARELHDGIAQTLFLSSVQVERLKSIAPHAEWSELLHSLHHIQEYVRRSIHTLKSENLPSISGQLHQLIEQFRLDTGIIIHYKAHFQEGNFTQKEKWEIIACAKEALTNIHKHAHATEVTMSLTTHANDWELMVQDNGLGYDTEKLNSPDCFGLRMMRERAAECGANFSLTRLDGKTIVQVKKGVE
jgi:signal transduction histidine kinase